MNVRMAGLKKGLMEMLKPPYPDIDDILGELPLWEQTRTILNSGRRPVKRCRFVAHNKHRDLGSVFAFKPNLRAG